MLRRSFLGTLAVIAGCAAVPVALLALFGNVMFMPPMWVHFHGVGVTALVAMAAAVFLMIAGAQQQDARTVVVAGGFALMAALSPWLYAPPVPARRLAWFVGATLLATALSIRAFTTA